MPTSGFNLSADDYDINEILQGSHQIRVPDYQREYSWSKDQWAELWDDVYALTRERDNHFLGSIVVINNKSEDIKTLELVDGQQRLTTISILLCVIRDRFEAEDDDDYSNLPELVNSNFLQIKNPTTGETHNKLKLNKFHNDDFKRVLDGNFDLIDDSEIKDAYEYYANRIVKTLYSEKNLVSM
ncbi:uncharacterized protein DUF262 [Halohasta litchfieldiae]|jgi:uncharacterized protein with ParB-like and HNH nuclease domain|uniref:GmrSD restriction endonucleases N-terminal domain-containing protein n=1 Tax=Halohasta litchfieldiae TaxID=1073996 RepID=A0A1H6TA22_9EURY|nr:DUF262 domain-containing protein [Halohasta litchfieldiae]ATW87027.1 uncharacterized protein DUF262 [Halohasta litchfieldiae]SEI72682.1 Protein of unknown function DUF262 [Halohasta litchfieldiae]